MSWMDPDPMLSARSVALARRVLAAGVAVAWLGVASLHAAFVITGIAIGRLPRYGAPDPKDLLALPLHALIWGALSATLVWAFLWIVFTPLFARAVGVRVAARNLILVCAALGILAWDPFGALSWFCD